MVQPLTDDLGFLLSRASGALVRATNTALGEHGLRVRQYSVLVLACEREDGVTQREVADVLGLDPSQVVVLVDELADTGRVERRPGPDRRTRLVVATPAGRRVCEAAGAAARAAQEGPLAGLDDGDRDRLREVLTRVWSASG